MKVVCEMLASMQSWRVGRIRLSYTFMTRASWSLLAEEASRGTFRSVDVRTSDIQEGDKKDVWAVKKSTDSWCHHDGIPHTTDQHNMCTML